MGAGIYLLIAICNIALAFGQTWEEPYFIDAGTEGITTDLPEGNNKNIYMHEEIEPIVRIIIINYDGDNAPIMTVLAGDNNYLQAEIQRLPDGEDYPNYYAIVVKSKQDFESPSLVLNPYQIRVVLGSISTLIILNIVNIDDNKPVADARQPSCLIPEGPEGLENDFECLYSVTDEDGMLSTITWTIQSTSHADINDIFEFVPTIDISDDNLKEMTVALRTKKELDFENVSLYMLSWLISDTVDSNILRVVVEVEDVADTAPRWTAIFASQQFDEKTEKSFEVRAVDGDVVINDNIVYEIRFTENDWSEYISINPNSGDIAVKRIDRDVLQNEIYTFSVWACEENIPYYCANQTITFLVDDVNDNFPIFTFISASFTLDEASISTIDSEIVINDIDLGVNARYDIGLVDVDVTKFSEAFSVAPSSGYQQTSVDLFITNPSLLDYENEEWQNFQFKLVATETDNPEHTNEITLTITLNNLNDELPIFAPCNTDSEAGNCIISIEETTPGEQFLVNMHASDRDIDDVVKLSLLGTYANTILSIDEDSGDITTKQLERPFDFETLSEIIIQVQAIDNQFPAELIGSSNNVVAQLTIRLIDVNDETPRISVDSTNLEIKENSAPDTEIPGVNIVATDDDTGANLVFSIDWESSYATKNGRPMEATAFEEYKKCINILTEGAGQRITAKLTINDVVENNTPNFELFDTLFLRIVATDQDQAEGVTWTSVNVPIYVVDINDNRPRFDMGTITASKTVSEDANPDVTIAIITATDNDVDDDIEYSLAPINGTDDGLIKIDTKTGQLLVSDGTIDADKPLHYLYYEISASDGDPDHTVTEWIEIFVSDVNDNDPEFTFNDGFTGNIDVAEKTIDGTLLRTFLAIDNDRDAPNNDVTYSFSIHNTGNEFMNFFDIDSSTGEFIVSYTNPDRPLDRDTATPGIITTIRITAQDKGQQPRSVDSLFTVTLIDINDQIPILRENPQLIETDEESKTLDEIGTITATDADEPQTDNSKINFKIDNIESMEGSKDPGSDLFTLGDNIIQNIDGTATCKLLAGKDLRDYYGRYTITITMEDSGNPQQSGSGNIIVTVNKVNFEDPTITYPDQDSFFFSRTQNTGMRLLMFGSGEMQNLEATDNQGGKWAITFTVEDNSGLFDVYSTNLLVITRALTEADFNVPFAITITARSGEPEKIAQKMITAIFVDDTAEPIFETLTHTINTFYEEQPSQSASFPQSKYEVDVGIVFPRYYIITDSNSMFRLAGSAINELHLDEALDREEQCCYEVIIQTSKSETGIANPESSSLLTVHIELIDINDNPPTFDEDTYYGTTIYDEDAGTTVVTMTATDLDPTSVITYTITTVDDSVATNFPTFQINSASGAVQLVTQPTTSARGYVTLTIEATDTEFRTQADLRIYIISRDQHIVNFVFNNLLTETEENRENIITVLMQTFKDANDESYECSIRRIRQNTDETTGEEIENQSVAEVYFLDVTKNEPVLKTEIEKTANDIQTYNTLEQNFRQYGLFLLSFSTKEETTDDIEDILRAWLIGVSVVLGALCLLLLVAFILKTRSLTKRLNKLSVTKYGSQESVNNRKVAPNTNRHALEGSNPVFSEEKKMPEFDQESISSGDSDLVGVENNPEFEYHSEKNGTLPRK